MKTVCLINPPTTHPGERRSYFPMALLCLGGVLRRGGVPTELWDFDLQAKRCGSSFLDLEAELEAKLKRSSSVVFCISSVCSNLPAAIWIAKIIRQIQPQALILLGGPQPSSIPHQLIEAFDFIDGVGAGEGETIFEDLMGAGFEKESLPNIPGMVSRQGARIVEQPKNRLIQDLDGLPFPDYSLIRIEDYYHYDSGEYMMTLEVGRGCPFRCTFCSTSIMWEREYRVKSPARIFEEMKQLDEAYGFKSFECIHDNFTTSRKFVNDFCDFMIQNNHRDYRWYAASRTDCLSIPAVEKMYHAGLRWYFFGIESGSERIQRVIKKKLDFGKFEAILRKANQLGIKSVTAYILGFPEEEADDIDQTILRAMEYRMIGTKHVYVAKLSPLAGTQIYEGNKDRLKTLCVGSTMSPLNFEIPYLKEIILRHPEIFSSYYHVPHPDFDSEFLYKLAEFSNLLLKGNTRVFYAYMKSFAIGPVALFSQWDAWAKRNGIEYCNFWDYPPARFNRDFQHFLANTTMSFSPLGRTKIKKPVEAIGA